MFPLNSSILLWCVCTRSLMDDCIIMNKFNHWSRGKLLTIITSFTLHNLSKLHFNHLAKVYQNLACFWFLLHQIDPCCSTSIIHYSRKIISSKQKCYLVRNLDITTYQFKTIIGFSHTSSKNEPSVSHDDKHHRLHFSLYS